MTIHVPWPGWVQASRFEAVLRNYHQAQETIRAQALEIKELKAENDILRRNLLGGPQG